MILVIGLLNNGVDYDIFRLPNVDLNINEY